MWWPLPREEQQRAPERAAVAWWIALKNLVVGEKISQWKGEGTLLLLSCWTKKVRRFAALWNSLVQLGDAHPILLNLFLLSLAGLLLLIGLGIFAKRARTQVEKYGHICEFLLIFTE